MAKSLLATTLVNQLRTLEAQLKEYRRRIAQAFADHPDCDLFSSLPGSGKKLAPRLLGEIGANREVFASAEALQRYAGTAAVTKQSGKTCFVHIRRACNKVLRATVHLWADESRRKCAWANAYYQQKKGARPIRRKVAPNMCAEYDFTGAVRGKYTARYPGHAAALFQQAQQAADFSPRDRRLWLEDLRSAHAGDPRQAAILAADTG
jgi:hypothetical protein